MKVTEKLHKYTPPPVGISALTQERSEGLVGKGPGSVERKKLEGHMAALHKKVVSKLKAHRCNSKRNPKRV